MGAGLGILLIAAPPIVIKIINDKTDITEEGKRFNWGGCVSFLVGLLFLGGGGMGLAKQRQGGSVMIIIGLLCAIGGVVAMYVGSNKRSTV